MGFLKLGQKIVRRLGHCKQNTPCKPVYQKYRYLKKLQTPINRPKTAFLRHYRQKKRRNVAYTEMLRYSQQD